MGTETAAVELATAMAAQTDHDLSELPPQARAALIDWATAYIGWSGTTPRPKRPQTVTADQAHHYAEHARRELRRGKSQESR